MLSEDQAFIDYLNNAMLAIYELTPPGSRQYKTQQENPYDRNGLPTEYTIRENSNNITDQTQQAQMMQLIDKTLFQHKRIAKVKQILFSNGVAELAQPEVRENLRSKFREEAVLRPNSSIEWIETTQIDDREEGVSENMDYNHHLYIHIMVHIYVETDYDP